MARTRGTRRGLAALALQAALPAALAVAAVAATVATATAPSGASAPRTVPFGHTPSVPSGSRPASAPLPPTITASVALRPADAAGLASFATAVSTPGTAVYHQFLTPAEVQARFGPSDATIKAARAWLSSAGLSVGATEGDGTVIPVSGSPTAVGAAFGTALANYRLPSGRTAYANTSPPQVPAALAPNVTAVVGLDDLHPATVDLADPRAASAAVTPTGSSGAQSAARPAMRPAARPATAGPAPCPAATTAAAALTTTVHGTTGHGATADQIAAAFDYTALYAQGDFGQGVTVGIFMGGGDYRDSDLAFVQQCYGLDGTVTRVPVDGGSPGVSSDASVEVSMDVQTVATLAPEADILVYEAPSLGTADTLNLYATAVQDNRAQVFTASFGGCELLGANPYAEAPLFEAMAAQGQSMFASSGDQGAQGCVATHAFFSPTVTTAPIAGDPASQPFVTSVGGVHIADLATPASSTSVWNWGPFPEWIGNAVASGGVSTVWAMPAWQASAADTVNDADTCGATGTTPCREVPDLSGNADSRNGEVIYCTVPFCVHTYETANGSDPAPGWFAGGGTSFSSPQTAALTALIDEGVPGNRVGLLSPLLYQVDRSEPSAFVDVTAGNNSYLTPTNVYGQAPPTCTYGATTGAPCYEATPGYDMATGLGLPVAGVLVPAIRALAVPPLSVTTTALPAATVGQQYAAALAATGGTAPYTWSVTAGSLPAGLVLDPATGAVSGTPTAAGSSGFVVTATDASTPSRTATVALAITVGSAAVTPVTPVTPAAFYGSMGGAALRAPVVGMAATPDGKGYWEVASDGGLFAFGDAAFFGSMGGTPLNKPIVGLAATPDGKGYWEVASDGGLFAFGDAAFFGSMGGTPLNQPVVGIAVTPDGHGYWEVASDGGLFAFGDAAFFGSMGGTPLNKPVVGIAATPDGHGYWEVASDGGLFAFGDAPFYGSTGGTPLSAPVVGMAVDPQGGGYWEVASDGGLFTFPGT